MGNLPLPEGFTDRAPLPDPTKLSAQGLADLAALISAISKSRESEEREV